MVITAFHCLMLSQDDESQKPGARMGIKMLTKIHPTEFCYWDERSKKKENAQ
jgi:hypothetical protein